MTQQACSITCGIPFFPTEGKQTNLSVALRATAVVLGALSLAAGALILINYPGLCHYGYAAISLGAVLAIVAGSVKSVKKEEKPLLPQWFDDNIKKLPKLDIPVSQSMSIEEIGKKVKEPCTLIPKEVDLCLSLNTGRGPISARIYLGIFFKLHAEYINNDSEGASCSKSSFSIYGLASKCYSDSNQWTFNTDPSSAHIIKSDQFKWNMDNALDEKTIQLLLNTEEQDKLPLEHQNNLAWILLRLGQQKDLIITASEPQAYWKISLEAAS